MTESERPERVRLLVSKLRTKAWYWLFRQPELRRGLEEARLVDLESARLSRAGELEIVTLPKVASVQERRPVGVVLRLTEGGHVSVTTTCASCGRPHCWHSAALLGRLSDTGAEGRLVELIETAGWSELEEAAEGLEGGLGVSQKGVSKAGDGGGNAVKSLVEIHFPQLRPVLVLKRLKAQVLEVSKRASKLNLTEVSLGVAVPMLAYAECPERFYLASSRLASYHDFDGKDGKRVRLYREHYKERSLLTEVRMIGLEPVGVVMPDLKTAEKTTGCMTVPMEQQVMFWAHFRESVVPSLMNSGWLVEVADDFGYQVVAPDEGSWFTDLEEEGDGKDWFSLNLGFEIAGRRISLVPVLARALDEGLTAEVLSEAAEENRQFRLVLDEPGDPVVEVGARRLLPLIRFLTELMSARPKAMERGRGKGVGGGAGFRLDRLRAAQLTDIGGLSIQVPASLTRLRERLLNFEGMQRVMAPAGLRAVLRPYQQDGVSWLQFLREFDLHGVLADDMGLGKTVQTIAHLLLEKTEGRMDCPGLVVAPTSVVRNWVREMKKFAPELKVLLLHGAERRSAFKKIRQHDVVVTTYPLLVRDCDVLNRVTWHVAVLDEAQNIKNPKSQAALAARDLKARHRVCLTGTPMENHLGELWSLFEFLMPGFLGDAETFRRAYRNPIEKKQDAERQLMLAQRVGPLLLRRNKDAVAKDLPAKTEMVHRIEIEGAQADLYETIRAAMDLRVREAIASQGMDRSHIVVLDALLKLRQVCCHPMLLKAEAAQGVKESAKLRFLMEEMLPELLEEGRRVLIFSQFTTMLALIEQGLKEAGIAFVRLTGDTRDREVPVQRFQAGEVPVFLISLKAGGAGLNLTAADTVIHYDPWWNPAVEAQASDRAHRIGQVKPVFVHKLICEGTIEEKILELQKNKAAMLESLLSGRVDRLTLSQADIQKLLEPL